MLGFSCADRAGARPRVWRHARRGNIERPPKPAKRAAASEADLFLFTPGRARACLRPPRCGETVIDSSNTFASLLLEQKCVAVVPGEAFGAPGFARLSYAVGEEKIREGVRRMAEFVASLR